MDSITIVSLDPIVRGGWEFKVSANDWETGVLIFAAHVEYGYSTVKYFLDSNEGRRWVDSLVLLDSITIATEVEKMKSQN